MAATVSGCLLSALLFEHAGSPGDQEGIFFGEISKLTTSIISDSQLALEKEETIINIHGFSCSHQLFSFYDNKASIIPEQLEFLLQGRKNVVGWYKFRRNSSLDVSLREHALHRALLTYLPGIKPQTFLFAIFTWSAADNLSTHDLDSGYFIMKEMQFESISLNIINLGDTNDSKYKQQANPSLGSNTGLYQEVVKNFGDSLIPGVNEVEAMYLTMEYKLQDLCNKVIASDKEVACLSNEVEELEQQLRVRQNKMKKKYSKDTTENHTSSSNKSTICNGSVGKNERNKPEQQQKRIPQNSLLSTSSKLSTKSSSCPASPLSRSQTFPSSKGRPSSASVMDSHLAIDIPQNLSCQIKNASSSEGNESTIHMEDAFELSHSPTF